MAGGRINFERFLRRAFGWRVIFEIRDKNIAVVQRREDRILISDNIIYSKLKSGSIYTKSYWDYLSALPALFERPKVLLLGFGGGTIPYQMNELFGKRVEIDAVEISPDMIAASKAFLPKESTANIIIGDGAAFVSKAKSKYDIIILDSYKKSTIPEQFFDEKFIADAYGALKDRGILAINYIFNVTGKTKESWYRKKLKKYFDLYTLSMLPPLLNEIIIASKRFTRDEVNLLLDKNFPKSKENLFIPDGYKSMH